MLPNLRLCRKRSTDFDSIEVGTKLKIVEIIMIVEYTLLSYTPAQEPTAKRLTRVHL
jgi:hypothetical protein